MNGAMRSEFSSDVWTTLQACIFAEFLVQHQEALTMRTQRIEKEMADGSGGK